LSYVALSGAAGGAAAYPQPAYGVTAQPMFAQPAQMPMVAPPVVQQAGYVESAGQAMYTAEQIQAAAASLRQQRARAAAPESSAAASQMEQELAKRERELDDKARRLEEAAKKLDGFLKQSKPNDPPPAPSKNQSQPKVNWRIDNPWGNYSLYKSRDWK
jgi:hypothetical protein